MNPSFLIIVVLLGLMWFVLIRPQRRRQLAQRTMLDGLSVGDEVVTAGGMYGQIRRLEENDLMVEIAPGFEVKIARRAIAGVIKEELEQGPAAEVPERSELAAPGEPGSGPPSVDGHGS